MEQSMLFKEAFYDLLNNCITITSKITTLKEQGKTVISSLKVIVIIIF